KPPLATNPPKSDIRNPTSSSFSYLALHPADDLFRQSRGNFLVFAEMHRKTSASLRARADIGRVTEHLRQRHHGLDDLGSTAQLHALDTAAPGVDIAYD